MSEQAAAGTRLTAREIHENILRPAEREMERPPASLLWSSLASGLVIGFSFLAAAGAAPWLEVLGEFVVPAVIGNAIGGVLLVALLNFGQVAPEKTPSAERRR